MVMPRRFNGSTGVVQAEVERALDLATRHAADTVKDDGHWLGPMSSDATITAEWIFLLQSIGREINDRDREAYKYHFTATQQQDGSWPVAPDYPAGGDLSVTIEAYLALKILGLLPGHPVMRKARDFVISHGGLEKMRIFTKFHLAMFGLLSWSHVPQMPPELVLLPPWFPINLYKFSSWARITIVPFLIIRTHEPIYPLPEGFLDELWCNDPQEGRPIPYAKDYLHLVRTDLFGLMFQIADLLIWVMCLIGFVPLRKRALQLCTNWIIERQEVSGDWAGIFPPMHLCIYALMLQGYPLDSEPIRRGLEALDRFCYETEKLGRWMQPCVSPVWDTFLMARGLLDASRLQTNDVLITRAIKWTRDRQITQSNGDWRVFRPNLAPGGFSFEYDNTWYPDVDDTAAGILAFLLQDSSSLHSDHVIRAAMWVLGMQNDDGGWAAFDVQNDAEYLNSIPFSDMDALCDMSCPDIVGRVLEAFGLMLELNTKSRKPIDKDFIDAIRSSCRRGIRYLSKTQESFGGWFGRWGTNYIYGTSNVLCGLVYFGHSDFPEVKRLIPRAVNWLQSVQNHDGGWGERLDSYIDIRRAGIGESTASQTAWAIMGLLPYVPTESQPVAQGVRWLVTRMDTIGERETTAGTWNEVVYTGTGFPGHFYLGYGLYSHYFPMMALGRYIRSLQNRFGNKEAVNYMEVMNNPSFETD